jgi:hypothetical protein
MRRSIAVCLLAACALPALPAASPAASAAAKRCGQVNVDLEPEGEGSAVRIRAVGVSCRRARRIARRCMKGTLTRGWSYRFVDGRIVLRRGAARVSWMPAGGGGCGG